MKRSPLTLIPLGLLIGCIAFGAVYAWQTRKPRALLKAPEVGLAWLRSEFHLDDSQYARIEQLHRSYEAECARLCQKVAEENTRLARAAAATNTVTDGLRSQILETGRLRDQCRSSMLEYLYAVARELPPAAAQRYLELMLESTCVVEKPRAGGSVHSMNGHSHE